MRGLLDASSQRIIVILETLAASGGWTTFSDLASAANASVRTVAEDISKLRKRWNRLLNLEVSKKNGIILRNRNAATIGMVFTDLFNDSIALRWIKEVLFHPDQAIDFYEKELFVSRSTLVRLLPKINRSLAQKGLTIACGNNRYRFAGNDEQYLRDFSACFLLELYGLDLQKFDLDLDLEIILRLVLSEVAKNLEPGELAWILEDDVSNAYWIMLYLVSLVREEQGYTITPSHPHKLQIDETTFAYLKEKFPDIAEENLQSIHQCFYNQNNGWDSDAEKKLVTRESEAFFRRILTVIRIPVDGETLHLLYFVLKSLYLNAKFRPYRTSVLFDRIYYFSLSLKRTNFLLYKAVEKNLKLFSRNVELDVCSKTADLLFWICLACPGLCQYTPHKTALLVDDFGTPHARFLAKVISDFFNHQNTDFLSIDIAGYPDLPTSDQVCRYDLLLTTIPNLPIAGRRVLLVNDYPSYEDFLEIYKALSSEPG